MKKSIAYDPYFDEGCIITGKDGVARHAFVFDYHSLSNDEKDNLLDEIEFACYENIREIIDEMTPFAVFYEEFYTRKKFGDKLSLEIVLSEDARPTGHLDLLMMDNESGKIVSIEEGSLAEFVDSDKKLDIQPLE